MLRLSLCLLFFNLVPLAAASQAQSDLQGISGIVEVDLMDRAAAEENATIMARRAQKALDQEDYARAASLFIAACTDSELGYCDRAQEIVESESKLKIPPDLQIILHLKACEFGREAACQRLTASLETADAGCVDGNAGACLQAGISRMLDQRSEADHVRGVQDYGKACDLGHLDACFNYAKFLSDGVYMPVNAIMAEKAFERACDPSHPHNCTMAGLFYGSDQSESQDLERAQAYLEKGCQFDEAFACQLLSTPLE